MFIRTLALGAILVACSAPTLAGASVNATAHASATSRGLVVSTSRFFPLMLIDQCTASGCGAGESARNQPRPQRELPRSRPRRSAGVAAGQRSRRVADRGAPHPWPGARRLDLSGRAGQQRVDAGFPGQGRSLRSRERRRAGDVSDDDRPVLPTAPFGSPQIRLSRYAAFAAMADMAGFDLYPLNACQSDLTSVYDAQRAFVKLAGSTPTFQWIETGPIRPTYCGGFAMTPEELIAEVWLAVIGGARGIGYFTHTWSPAHDSLALSPPMATAIRQTNSLLAAVRPGLLGATIESDADSPVVKVVARSGGGRTYVFAINAMRSPNKAGIRVPQLRDGLVTVRRRRPHRCREEPQSDRPLRWTAGERVCPDAVTRRPNRRPSCGGDRSAAGSLAPRGRTYYRALSDCSARPFLGLPRGARLDARPLSGVRDRAGAGCAAAGARGGHRANGHGDRRGLQRGVGDRAPDREPARARLPGGQAADRRHAPMRRSDRTEEIALQYPGVQVISNPRGGKVAAQDRAVRQTDGEIVAFSDANCTWSPDALRTLVRAFADPDVAYVCGQLRILDADGCEQGGRLLALRDGRARRGVAARLGHRRQRLDLRRASRRLRRGRPAFRPRSLASRI